MNRTLCRKRRLAFTLVELMVVMAIIALLVGLISPAYSVMIQRANSLKCATNLRSIGVAVNLAATDNNNQYPEIDQAGAPIYNPQGPSLLTVLSPYNFTAASLQCPVDMQSGTGSSYQKYATMYGTNYASSYEWDPVFDDESVNATVAYITPTVAVPVSNARVRLCMDFLGIHHGRPNVLYADGHVANH